MPLLLGDPTLAALGIEKPPVKAAGSYGGSTIDRHLVKSYACLWLS
jgi:hypothetical protein